jgi:hypothetical protein
MVHVDAMCAHDVCGLRACVTDGRIVGGVEGLYIRDAIDEWLLLTAITIRGRVVRE